MSFVFANPNEKGIYTIDCVVRALSIATNSTWEEIFVDIFIQGYLNKDMPSSNKVWGDYLKYKGFKRYIIPDTCPDCYTVRDFCQDYPTGTYILGTGSHVIAVKDGDYYDTWDSGNELPIYYWKETVGDELSDTLHERIGSELSAILPESADDSTIPAASTTNSISECQNE